MRQEKIIEFEKKIGYTFENPYLLVTALTHSSYSNEKRLKKYKCNERLEFLGDAVLELISSEYIFKENPQKPEGDLTRIRASYVCEPTLAACARDISLGDYLLLGKGEVAPGAESGILFCPMPWRLRSVLFIWMEDLPEQKSMSRHLCCVISRTKSCFMTAKRSCRRLCREDILHWHISW